LNLGDIALNTMLEFQFQNFNIHYNLHEIQDQKKNMDQEISISMKLVTEGVK